MLYLTSLPDNKTYKNKNEKKLYITVPVKKTRHYSFVSNCGNFLHLKVKEKMQKIKLMKNCILKTKN